METTGTPQKSISKEVLRKRAETMATKVGRHTYDQSPVILLALAAEHEKLGYKVV